MNENLDGIIEQYKRKLETVKSGNQVPAAPVWQYFNDIVAKMSPEQMGFVQTSSKAVQAKKEMNGLFLEWMFERFKNDFVADPRFEAEARRYVDCIESVAAEFSEHNKNLAKENEALKAEIERLKREAV